MLVDDGVTFTAGVVFAGVVMATGTDPLALLYVAALDESGV
jgi:hypothetical protein